jgi:hypothetical protein
MHEVSPDGVTWSRATSFPELFAGTLPAASPWSGNGGEAAAAKQEPVLESAATTQEPPKEGPPQHSAQMWHYLSGGVQCGPVDFSNLQMLVGTGQISADDSVWSPGMPNWISAAQVPGLVRGPVGPTQRTKAGSSTPPPTEVEVNESLCRSAADSRMWAVIISIVAFIFAASQVVSGIVILAAAGGAQSGFAVAQGIFLLIHAIFVVIGGALLATYASRLGGLRYSRMSIVLERSLDALRAFWIFLSIYLIIIVAFMMALFVYAISIGASLSGAFDGLPEL